MSYTGEKLKSRQIPPISDDGTWGEPLRKKIISLFEENVYGRTPRFSSEVTAAPVGKPITAFAGKGMFVTYELTVTTPNGPFRFPVYLTYPKDKKNIPLIVSLSFGANGPSGWMPDEDVLDRGIAVAKIRYADIANDSYDNFEHGVACMFPRNDPDTDWGKIGMWAWAASRALDFLLTLDIFDTERIAVCGHSRLGKTALWCGAQDTRFTHVISNNAGCSGDAITRGKQGEDIEAITRVFGYWFCGNYKKFAGEKTYDMPVDQHMLMAAIAPRRLAVGASDSDTWADPESEFLCCAAASEAWESLGQRGLVHPDRDIRAGDNFNEGSIAFHIKSGAHSFIKEDWMLYADFLLG